MVGMGEVVEGWGDWDRSQGSHNGGKTKTNDALMSQHKSHTRKEKSGGQEGGGRRGVAVSILATYGSVQLAFSYALIHELHAFTVKKTGGEA